MKFTNFKPVPQTGVIYVMQEAAKLGYKQGSQDWSNLGQGAPETGSLPGSPERLSQIEVTVDTSEYSPVAGSWELRDAVAQLYNKRYRKGKSTQYSAENVAIASGGRTALTRIVATLGNINLGHFLPDYTAYEELLEVYRSIVPIPITLSHKTEFQISIDQLEEEIIGKGLGAVLISNPCNPTGHVINGETLNRWTSTTSRLQCALIIDEFYSHYIYSGNTANTVSAAEFVEDIESEPVVILDGLTKNWRYPGLRLSWTLGPKEIINRVASAGSFLDGGPAHPIQSAALRLVNFETATKEAKSIQEMFSKKRSFLLESLKKLKIEMVNTPEGGFYAFPNLSQMPEKLRDGMTFFHEALKHNVIVVPGEFFDVDPGNRRDHIPSRLKNYIRVSFGPSMQELERGMNSIKSLIQSF